MLHRLVLFSILTGCTSVPPGHRGVQIYFSELQPGTLDPGLYSSVLMTIVPVSTQVQATEAESSATTNDLQNVTTTVTLNWSRDPKAVREQYRTYPYIVKRIIYPAIQESVKSVTAQYTATDLVQKRQEVKQAIIDLLTKRLGPIGIVMDTVNITDFAFSDDFNLAIEAKVKAEQEALRAKEELQKTKIVAQQAEAEAQGKKAAAILKAEGDARAIDIRGAALKANPQVLELKRIETWNGVMPSTLISGGSEPLINIMTGE